MSVDGSFVDFEKSRIVFFPQANLKFQIIARVNNISAVNREGDCEMRHVKDSGQRISDGWYLAPATGKVANAILTFFKAAQLF